MHVALGLYVIFAVWKWGDWKHWQKYHLTMLFMAAGNLLYNFLTASYFLWRLDADFLSNHTLTELIYTFVVFPGTVLLFIGNSPKKGHQFIHILKWIIIYISVEVIFYYTGHIKYQHGWTIGWSLLFDIIMFPTLKLHVKHPLLAYAISALVATAVILYFDVPVHLPVETR